jgi:hypothetical protein
MNSTFMGFLDTTLHTIQNRRPSVNSMISRDKKVNGTKVTDTVRESISVGTDVYYRFPKVSVTAIYLYDACAKNLPKVHFLSD